MSQLQVTGEAKIRDIQGPVVANSGVITALDGAASQYVRGDGTLADFPTSSGGGSSVSYYLNSSVSQGTIGGVAYRELSKEPIIGAGTDIAISANGYVASYLTDANDPDVLSIPGGNFNCEFYFSVNNNTGNPFFYAELYKYDGTTFTLLGSSVGVPEYINQGTIIAPYYFAIPVPTSALALTDRLAIRIYVNVDGRTVTLHTENGHLCQVVTTLSKGMVSLNNLTDQSQFLTTGTSGTNFAIVSSGDTHTFNLPIASATNTGKLSSTDWSTFNGKVPYTGATGSVDLGVYSLSAGELNIEKNGANTSAINFEQATGTSILGAGYTSIGPIGTDGVTFFFGGATNSLTFKNNLLSASRSYSLPDASGTLALTSNLSSYVPYTGATAAVNLGAFGLSASSISLTDSVYLQNNKSIWGTDFAGTTQYNLLSLNIANKVGIDAGGLGAVFGGTLTGTTYTANGSGSQGGTIALKQNGLMSAGTGYTTLGSLSAGQLVIYFGDSNLYAATFLNTSLTDSRSYTLPNLSGTLALLEGTQTFTGAKTFSLDILVNGLTVGRGGGSISTNTVLGTTALSSNTTGASNVAIGINSLNTNTTGGSNVAVGQSSLQTNNSNQNTAIGNQAMQFNTTGTANTGIGHTALQNNTTGNNNIAIGYESGKSITTGSNNTIIGNYAGTTTLANNIVLADGAGNIRYQWNGTFNNFNGDAAFSGAITATSSIKGLSLQIQNAGFVSIITSTPTATRSIVVPDASGTLALTSDLSAYLPLTGGTLTGALIGTTATFSGTVSSIVTSGGTSFRVVNSVNSRAWSLVPSTNGAESDLWLYYGGTGTGTKVSFVNNGNVLIGSTTDSGELLQVNGTSKFTGALSGTSATFSGVITGQSNGNTFGTASATGRAVIIQAGSSNQAIMFKNAAGGDGTLFINGTSTSIDYNFNTYSVGDALVIKNSGNVGIGTSSPDFLLSTSKSSTNYISIDNTSNNYRLLIGAETSATALYSRNLSTNAAVDMRFVVGTSESMRITSGGNVGIGTNSPSYKLDVSSNINDQSVIRSINTNAGNLATARVYVQNDSGTFGQFTTYSSGFGFNVFGTNAANFTALLSSGASSNGLLIGALTADPVIFGTDGNERMRITSGGNVLIGDTTNNGYKLDVLGQTLLKTVNSTTVAMQRQSTDGIILAFYKDASVVGTISTNSNSLPSDLNFKKNINNLELGLNLVTKLRAVSYNHKIDDDNAALSTGFIAQELEQSLTELGVKENEYNILQHKPNEDEKQSKYWLDYTKMIPILVNAIQEQQAQIELLSNKIVALESK
jgi:hypothetical protein